MIPDNPMEPPIVPAQGLSTLRAGGRSLPTAGGRRFQPVINVLPGHVGYRGLSEGHGRPERPESTRAAGVV